MESQGFPSYRKKKKLTERIFKNFQSIKLRPEGFSDYLINTVGFECGRTIAIPCHTSKGFQRPLQIFIKRPPLNSSRTVSSRQTTPYLGPSPFGCASTPYDGPSPMFTPNRGCCLKVDV